MNVYSLFNISVLKRWDSMLSGLFLLKKPVHVGIYINSEDYGISHTYYPYTPILIRHTS